MPGPLDRDSAFSTIARCACADRLCFRVKLLEAFHGLTSMTAKKSIIAALLLAAFLLTSGLGAAGPSDDEVARARLLLSRATYGARPGDLDAVLAKGTKAWLEEQLEPERIDDRAVVTSLGKLDNLQLSTTELMRKFPQPSRAEREAMLKARESDERMAPPRDRRGLVLRELWQAKLYRAVHSERQLQEVMSDFWFNHFNVYARKNRNTLLTLPSYERDAIRPYALGRFEDLLTATAEHPAMLFYLDNWVNTKEGFDPREALRGQLGRRGRDVDEKTPRRSGINENYARELMELHTLGVDGGYEQKDVVEVARALTGWSVIGPQAVRVKERIEERMGRGRMPEMLRRLPDEGSFFFNELAHDDGVKTILGERIEEGKGGARGIDAGYAVIELLARHPSTARFISTKLAQKFVSDTPSNALVDAMSATFLRTRGDIRQVLRTMFHSEHFLEDGMASEKVKTPLELVASAVRATGAEVRGPALARTVAELGMPLYLCQPPTGYDEQASSWLGAGSILTRIRFATDLANSRLPGATPTVQPRDFEAWASEILLLPETLPVDESEGLTAVEQMAFFLSSPAFQRQ